MGQPPTFMYTLFACRRRHTDTNRKLLRTKLLPLSPCIHNPSDLPLPSFHAYQHKTNKGGGLSNLHSNSYMFYTPLTVQHSVLSHRQLMSSMTHGNGTPHSRTCMPYLTRIIRKCDHETTCGRIYDNACSRSGLPSREQAYGSARLYSFIDDASAESGETLSPPP